MQPTMTIIKKDGSSFPVPYSEQNVIQYQKILGDQIADIIFNNVQNPPNIQLASGPKAPTNQTPSIDTEELKKELQSIKAENQDLKNHIIGMNAKLDMILENVIRLKPEEKVKKERVNKLSTV